MATQINTETVTTLADLVARAFEIAKGQGGTAWWRGLADGKNHLVPAVFRDDRGPNDERNLIARFLLSAGSRYQGRLPENAFSWLFLMQHYRLPTRLLDWTESVLVAAYFAVSAKQGEDGAVWALDPLALNSKTIGEARFGVQGDPKVRPLFDAAIKGETNTTEADVIAVMPHEVDFRMLVQLGRATVHNQRAALDDRKDAGVFLRRLTIPRGAKPMVQAELDLLGIRESNLFPDLEHLALDLGARRFSS